MRGMVVIAATGIALVAPVRDASGDRRCAGARWTLGPVTATGSMPWGVSVSADGTTLYVTHVGQKDHDTVRRLDASTLRVEARAGFRGHAVESTPSRDGASLVVSNSRRHELVILDATSLAVIARRATGRIPKDFRLSPDGTRAFVADYGDGTLSAVELATGARRSIPVGKRARGIAISADGATVYVTSMASHRVAIIDTAALRITAMVRTCASPRHLALTARGELLVTCMGGRHVDVLDAATGARQRRIRVGRGPKTIAVSPDQEVAITANERDDSITVIDLATWETCTLAVPLSRPCGLAIAPAGDRVYVTGRGSHELLVVERTR